MQTVKYFTLISILTSLVTGSFVFAQQPPAEPTLEQQKEILKDPVTGKNVINASSGKPEKRYFKSPLGDSEWYERYIEKGKVKSAPYPYIPPKPSKSGTKPDDLGGKPADPVTPPPKPVKPYTGPSIRLYCPDNIPTPKIPGFPEGHNFVKSLDADPNYGCRINLPDKDDNKLVKLNISSEKNQSIISAVFTFSGPKDTTSANVKFKVLALGEDGAAIADATAVKKVNFNDSVKINFSLANVSQAQRDLIKNLSINISTLGFFIGEWPDYATFRKLILAGQMGGYTDGLVTALKIMVSGLTYELIKSRDDQTVLPATIAAKEKFKSYLTYLYLAINDLGHWIADELVACRVPNAKNIPEDLFDDLTPFGTGIGSGYIWDLLKKKDENNPNDKSILDAVDQLGEELKAALIKENPLLSAAQVTAALAKFASSVTLKAAPLTQL